ncbi:MAG: hydroxyisourate hydrolase [Gemmatimonadaceae bacterium]
MTTDSAMAHTLSTYVLDTALGRPARAMDVTLERMNDDGAITVGGGTTSAEGRIASLTTNVRLTTGAYRLRFDTEGYFTASGRDTFYPEVAIHFRIGEQDAHCHVVLHVSPFGYSTARER